MWAFIEGVVAAAGGVGACAGRWAEGRGGAALPRCLTRPWAAARAARHDHIVLSQQYVLPTVTAASGQEGRGVAHPSLKPHNIVLYFLCQLY